MSEHMKVIFLFILLIMECNLQYCALMSYMMISKSRHHVFSLNTVRPRLVRTQLVRIRFSAVFLSKFFYSIIADIFELVRFFPQKKFI